MARVTIVGGGYGGITAAKALDDVAEVTLVEQKDTFVSHAAALRAAVDRDWAEKIFLPYDKLLTKDDLERELIRKALIRFNGHRKQAADQIGISERTLYRKIKEYGLDDL